MKYEAVIGIEVHVQLQTHSKMFCACDASIFGRSPNTHVCPVCLGLPGVLPVINRQAVAYAIMTGLALNCHIAEYSVFARKNYHYPDLPKGYQISQYELPLCRDGWLEFQVEGQSQRVGITRAHLEEDTGRLAHSETGSLIDYNRAGIPLLEIVTGPDIRSGEAARQYLIKLRAILRYLGVSSGDMEKGAMRCEPNVSLRPLGSQTFGDKVEVKNLNSIRAVKLALDYEIQRQASILDSGGKVTQVTVGWDERRGITVVQRSKEHAEDYRYFPEPDLSPLQVSREWVAEIQAQQPELPDAKKARFVRQYGLTDYEAEVLVAEKAVARYFEDCAAAFPQPKIVANWIIGDIFCQMNQAGVEIDVLRISPQALAELLTLVEKKTITMSTAREILSLMFQSGTPPADIVAQRGLAQISDTDALATLVAETLRQQPDAVRQYLDGKTTILQFLMGQVMRASRGKANPQLVQQLLQEQLAAIRRQP
ncbi:MAG: Asp-tRNA(Asn)/Glu-tRNA(Gln) amidotransferase subunit GatB [Chloroflexota bacterium]